MSVPYFTPITEINYTNNTTVNTSTYVRVFNGYTGAHLVSIIDPVTTVTIGSFTIGASAEAFVKKEPRQQINVAAATGATSVKLTGIYF